MSPTPAPEEKDILLQLCQEAMDAIQAVLEAPPRDRHQIVDDSERALVRLRDRLIRRYRQEEDAQVKSGLRSALDQVNIAVSLITGVEYPGAGIQEKTIEQAQDVLKGMDLTRIDRSPSGEGTP